MSRFNLKKGDRFPLSKESGLNKIQVDLTWKSGADLDASAFLLGADGVIMDDADFVFYNSDNRSEPWNREKFGSKANWRGETIPVSADGSVLGSPDDLGEGDEEEGDDAGETMHVILNKVNPKVQEIIFCVTIYHTADDDVTFGQVREPAIVITNEETGEELCRYDLKENFSSETAVEAGKLVCNEDGEWEFEAVGQGYTGGMQTLIDMYA